MFFEKRVPAQARAAYRKDAWAALIVGVYSGAIGPYMMIIARDSLHAPDWQMGLMTAAPAIGSLFALFWANAMEGKAKMPFVVWSMVAGRILFVAMLFCFTPLSFALCVTASQILVTISGPAYASVIKDVYPSAYRGRIMSYCKMLLSVVMVATTLAVGWLLDIVSYRYVFAVGGIFGVVSALVFGRIKLPADNTVHKKPPTVEFLINAFMILKEDRRFRWFAMSVFTYGFGNLIVAPIYAIFIVDQLHIKPWHQSWLMMLYNIVFTLSYLFWGKYVDFISPVKCAAINVFVTGIIPINYFLASYIGTPWALVPAYMVSGLINAGIDLSYFNSLLHFSDETRVTHYQALFACLFGIRGIIAPFIGTSMKSGFDAYGWDYRYIFLMALVIVWAGGMMQLAGLKRKYSRSV